MKKSLLALCTLLFIYFAQASTLVVHDPLVWGNSPCNIDSAKISVTPLLYYARVDLELVYSARGSNFFDDPNEPSLEVVTDFYIPENTIVIDSWLWIENYISEAYLIDIYTATNIYESYVVRTQDPSLLRYNDNVENQLDLNIYPLPSNSSRKVKLSFLVPITDESALFTVNPIVDLFKFENSLEQSYCELIVNNHGQFEQGGLITSPINYSVVESNSSFTKFEMDINKINNSFRIGYQNNSLSNEFAYYSTPDASYYFIEKFIPMNTDNCTFGSLDKVMDQSSIILDNYLVSEVRANGVVLRESGQYFNNPPEAIVLEYICDSLIYKDTLADQATLDPSTEKIWAKHRIDQFSFDYNDYYSSYFSTEISQIIDLSMEHRVLSRYTAFLALPQEDTIQAMADGGGFGSQVFPVGIDFVEYEESLEISAYPNPMLEFIDFKLKAGFLEYDAQVVTKIIDLSGKQIAHLPSTTLSSQDEVSIRWNGQNGRGKQAASGIYFALIQIGEDLHTVEFLKK